jgi:hypothetical protein
MKLTTHLLRLRMSGAVPLLPPMPLWRAHGLYCTNLMDSTVIVKVSRFKHYSAKEQEFFLLCS